MLNKIVSRLAQKSTVAGIVSLLGLAGIAIPDTVAQAASLAVVAVAQLYEIVRDEVTGG